MAVLGLFELLDFVVTFIHKEGMGRTEEEINLMIRDRLNDTVGTLLEQRNEKPPVRVNLQDSLEKVSEKSGLFRSSFSYIDLYIDLEVWRAWVWWVQLRIAFTSFQTRTLHVAHVPSSIPAGSLSVVEGSIRGCRCKRGGEAG